jgi:hypothetical protein
VNCSSERAEIVSGVASQDGEIIAHARIGLGTLQSGQEFCSGEPTATARAHRGECGDGPTLDGDSDVLPGLHAAENVQIDPPPAATV